MAAKKEPKKPTTPAKPRRKKAAAPASAGLDASACALPDDAPELRAVSEAVHAAGGVVVARYKDPLGGHALAIAVLPIAKVEPTPFQRDLSEAHHKRLADVIGKTGRFLDPVIAVRAPVGDGFWTPNGRHRLAAMQRLGAKAITALIVPTPEIAWQILALNTEKAHNVKERALEVIRIYRGLLAEDGARAESSFAFYLEDPALVVLGVCYEKSPRFAAGAYHPVLRRVLTFTDDPIGKAIARHEKLAVLTLEVEARVSEAVAKLRERGLVSPYLRSFVVARINPLRFAKGEPPPAEQVLTTMRDRAAKFDAGKVKQDDLARMGGGAAPDQD